MPKGVVETLRINVEYKLGNKNPAQSLQNIAKALEHLNEVQKRLDFSKVAEQLNKLTSVNLATFADQMKTIGNAFKDMGIKMPKLDATKVFEVQGKLQELKNIVPTADSSKVVEIVEQISEEMTGVVKKTDIATKNTKKLKDEATGVGKALKDAPTFMQKFVSSVKRIAFYRILRRLIQIIGQAFKQGIENIAKFSKETNSAMSELLSSWNYFKNSIGSIVAPLVQIVTPVVTRIVDLFVDLNNTVAEFFAVMNNQSTFIKAKKTTEDYAKSLQKVQNLLYGFDEINKGSSTSSTSDMYEVANVSSSMVAMTAEIQNIKNAISDIVGRVEGIIGSSNELAFDTLPSVITLLSTIAGLIDTITAPIKPLTETVNKILVPVLNTINTILSFIFGKIDDFVKGDSEKLTGFFEITSNFFDKSSTFNDILSGFKDELKTIKDRVKEVTNGLQEWVDKHEGLKKVLDVIKEIFTTHGLVGGENSVVGKISNIETKDGETVGEKITGFFKGLWNKLKDWDYTYSGGYANGGFVDNATLFYANENGIPEMVGQIGNHAAVANNDQIIEGIKRGVMEAMNASNQGDIIIQLIDKNGNITGEEVIDALQQRNRREGKTIVPVLV